MSEVWKHDFDPKLLERLFSNPRDEPDPFGERQKELEEQLIQEECASEEVHQEIERRRLRLRKFFDKLPPREKDMLIMRYMEGKSQPQIAEFFEITQAAVSYRIGRALKRIEVYNKMIDIDEDMMHKDFAVLFDELTVNILITMFETSTQSETARRLGKSQFCIRSRFFDSMKILKNGIEEGRWRIDFLARVKQYVEIFDIIQNNWHILQEKLHKWKKAPRVV